MQESGMLWSWVHEIRHTELFYPRKPLHQRMLYYIQKQSARNLDESEYRIVYYLAIVQYLISLFPKARK